jgi:recombination protein RecR
MPEALKRLIDMINFLPGIGEKTAAKLAFFLLKAHPAYVANFARSLGDLHRTITECSLCHGMTDMDHPICRVCSDDSRDHAILCIVEDYLDMLSIERTGVYRGLYHVLGGVVSPISGVTPDKLHIASIFDRMISESPPHELILALNPNLEWEATALYIIENNPKKDIKISRLSKWLPHAGSIEYADEITLLAAFRGRG